MEWIQKQFLNLKNGETLAYIDTSVGQQTLVLIHGNLSSSYHWMPLIHSLKDQYRILAFDLRGFGDSSYHHRFDSLETLAEDVQEALTILKISDYVVAGWSAGGGVAMALASQDTRVKKLILMSSMSYRGLPVYRKDSQGKMILGATYGTKEALAEDPIQVLPLLKAFATQDRDYMTWLWNLVIYNVRQPDQVSHSKWIDESLKQRNLVDIDWAIMHFNYGVSKTDYAAGDGRIKAIQVPVLSIWGKQDKTVLEFMVRETAFVFGDRCQLVVLDDCGHNPLVDQFAKVHELIKTFIA
jgi:pimeloyl-ACP methyl ester carboxylesterase